VDAQTIGVIAAVFSSAIAGLGLLLNWYKSTERKRPWVLAFAGSALVVSMTAGVAFAFVLDSTDATVTSNGTLLTEDQYQEKAGAACSKGFAKATRIAAAIPTNPISEGAVAAEVGVSAQIEGEIVENLEKLHPPRRLNPSHDKVLAIWTRRVNLLEALHRDFLTLRANARDEQFGATDRRAKELEMLFQEIGVPECII
jgi:hypothetical protein